MMVVEYGVDLVIPDTNYLNDKTDRIRGILITHGHEDHVGGLPYVLPMLDFPPIYATRLTQGLISVKLKEHRLLDKAISIVIRTPIGTIVHTGDYKFDHTPIDGRPADFGTLARIGNEGVLVMMGDSTRVETPGYTPSERVINDSLDKIF